jgi:hypothetical protein
MTYPAIRAALASTLENTNLRVYERDIDLVEPPCLVVGNPSISYDDTNAYNATLTWPVFLVVSRNDSARAIAAIDGFLDPSVPTTVPAVIDANNNLSGTAAAARVARADGFDATGYTWANETFAGVTFSLEILT